MRRIFTLLILLIITITVLSAPLACSPNSTANADVTINLTAQNILFDKNTITVPAGATVAIVFDNKDTIIHNFSLYEDSTASKAIFIGKTISKGKITYTFTAPSVPGTYFFRCDVHPSTMIGDFIVT